MSESTDYSNKHVEFVAPEPTPEEQAELNDMYAKMDDLHMKPLWNQIGGLMPNEPDPQAVAHRWDWSELIKLARRSGELVPVGRGGERRAFGLATRAWAARPTSPPPCGPRSSTSPRVRTPRSTATPRTPSASSSRARACGPSSTATPFR